VRRKTHLIQGYAAGKYYSGSGFDVTAQRRFKLSKAMEKQNQKKVIERKIAQLWRLDMEDTDLILEVTAFCQRQDYELDQSEIKTMVTDASRILKARMA